MRSRRLFAHDPKGVIPRMSWSPHNLYNLINRSMPFYASNASFKKSSMTMYQQRWRSKKLLRGYHGDWVREKQFKRWFLPVDLPNLKKSRRDPKVEGNIEERMPISSLFVRDVERRLDTVVFRCCFARSAREAKALVVQGKVHVNGRQVKISGTLLKPGDLISVQPDAVPMLSKEAQKAAEMRLASGLASGAVKTNGETDGISEEGAVEAPTSEATSEVEQQEASTSLAGKVEAAELGEATPDKDSEIVSERASGDGESSTKPSDTSTAADSAIRSKQRIAAETETLAPGVFPFNLPPFATPFLFIPPYLEVSFVTCSAIYMRHPTITPAKSTPSRPGRFDSAGSASIIAYKTDIPSPYPAGGDLFPLAWEHYTKTAPRTRSDMRRLRLQAKMGREGMKTARAQDQWKKVRAIRRGYDKTEANSGRQFIVGSRGKKTTIIPPLSGRSIERDSSQARV